MLLIKRCTCWCWPGLAKSNAGEVGGWEKVAPRPSAPALTVQSSGSETKRKSRGPAASAWAGNGMRREGQADMGGTNAEKSHPSPPSPPLCHVQIQAHIALYQSTQTPVLVWLSARRAVCGPVARRHTAPRSRHRIRPSSKPSFFSAGVRGFGGIHSTSCVSPAPGGRSIPVSGHRGRCHYISIPWAACPPVPAPFNRPPHPPDLPFHFEHRPCHVSSMRCRSAA